jgi:C-terminal processing protease CtpA/Prc
MTAEEVAPLIRGPVGTTILLEVLRPGASKTVTVSLQRRKIDQSGPAPREVFLGTKSTPVLMMLVGVVLEHAIGEVVSGLEQLREKCVDGR